MSNEVITYMLKECQEAICEIGTHLVLAESLSPDLKEANEVLRIAHKSLLRALEILRPKT